MSDQEYQQELLRARRYDATRDEQEEETPSAYQEAYSSFQRVATEKKYKAPIEAAKLAFRLRKAAEEHQKSPWIIALSFAIICDSMDFVPIAGWIITWFFRPFLFIFLWGKGSWRIRGIYYGLLLIDYIPAINIIPLSTMCVLYAYNRSRKKYLTAENELKLLSAN